MGLYIPIPRNIFLGNGHLLALLVTLDASLDVGEYFVHLDHALLPLDLGLLPGKLGRGIETCHYFETECDGSCLPCNLLWELDRGEQDVEVFVQSLSAIQLSFRLEERIFTTWTSEVSLLLGASLSVRLGSPPGLRGDFARGAMTANWRQRT